jgi:hypothetical protein
VVGNKRARDEVEPPCLSLATAVPLSVWQDHLTPWLSRVEAVRLRRVCKTLRGVMDECPVDLGAVRADVLADALTCFPAAPGVNMVVAKELPAARKSKLLKLLRQHGGTLKRVTAEEDRAKQLLYSAVRARALPKLTYFKMTASSTEHGQWLSDGRLRLLEEVHVELLIAEAFPSSMEHLRQLPHLRVLTIQGLRAPMPEAVFPAFIPSSLKTLTLDCLHRSQLESLLLQLPPMLQASGAGLEALQVISAVKISDESGVALARVLQSCSSTLKTFRIVHADVSRSILKPHCAEEVALGLVSCGGLERLEMPWEIFKCLPPTCPTFTRLPHLTFRGDNAPIELTSPVWDRVTSGQLPALADFHLEGRKELSFASGRGFSVFLCALEAVAGTLRRLTLRSAFVRRMPSTMGSRLGVVIGKMRRLRYLSIRLTREGQFYHAMGCGLAAFGGCPQLRELHVSGVRRDFDCLTFEPSLIVPSVRSLHISGGEGEGEDVLVLYCGLVQMRYKHRLITEPDVHQNYHPCLAAILKAGGIHAANA